MWSIPNNISDKKEILLAFCRSWCRFCAAISLSCGLNNWGGFSKWSPLMEERFWFKSTEYLVNFGNLTVRIEHGLLTSQNAHSVYMLHKFGPPCRHYYTHYWSIDMALYMSRVCIINVGCIIWYPFQLLLVPWQPTNCICLGNSNLKLCRFSNIGPTCGLQVAHGKTTIRNMMLHSFYASQERKRVSFIFPKKVDEGNLGNGYSHKIQKHQVS